MNQTICNQFDGDAINRVSTNQPTHNQPDGNIKTLGGITTNKNPMLLQSLGTVLRGLKARITYYANQNNIDFKWQSRFHDRIIRNQHELNQRAVYIENNVANWHLSDPNKNE